MLNEQDKEDCNFCSATGTTKRNEVATITAIRPLDDPTHYVQYQAAHLWEAVKIVHGIRSTASQCVPKCALLIDSFCLFPTVWLNSKGELFGNWFWTFFISQRPNSSWLFAIKVHDNVQVMRGNLFYTFFGYYNLHEYQNRKWPPSWRNEAPFPTMAHGLNT